MNSVQLYNALRVILKPYKIKSFDVLSSDKIQSAISKSKSFPSVYIVNILPSYSKTIMGHWVVIIIVNCKTLDIFDSFGKNLVSYNQSLFRFLNNYTVIQLFRSVQNIDSELCGQYTLWYIKQRMQGYNFSQINAMFSRNTKQNDEMIQSFYNNLKPLILDNYKSVCMQKSCSKRQFICENVIYC